MFNKLVRDKIVEHQLKTGATPKFRKLNKQEHQNQLVLKLIEEAKEVLEAKDKDIVAEIADVKQVLDDLIEQHNIALSDISHAQKLKNQKHGAFKKGIYIDYIDIEEDDPFTDYYRSNPDRYPEVNS
ncbi:MAG TPA: nucleoside triphosphate pyrophosphohydrolase [Candidatus Saccharimonadales bacterium]|nr:nucleoside triphosphate pyrophosphohydrolase [Candidatus Saccharimonadales bacterium]